MDHPSWPEELFNFVKFLHVQKEWIFSFAKIKCTYECSIRFVQSFSFGSDNGKGTFPIPVAPPIPTLANALLLYYLFFSTSHCR